jgi:Putative Flp pilus-assembly TadE/G-like
MPRRLLDLFRDVRQECGGVLVIVAFAMPALIGFTGLVIDVGNWFEHRRHLQTQADAAALAAAGDVRFPCNADVNAAINARIEEYGKTRNPQVGSTPPAGVEWALNSRHWPQQPTGPLDNTVVEGPPCTAGMIDVKMTEHDLPWFLEATGVVDHINVKARVSLFTVTRQRGALPIGVPDVNPEAVRVWFVDETTGTEIPDSSKLLKRRVDADGNPVFQDGLQIWDNAADNDGTPLPLRIEQSKLGMRVALSRDPSTTDCGDPAVECYDAGSANGLLFVRGHATTPAVQNGSEPELRDAWLLPGTCGDGYFSAQTAECTVQLNARIDLAPNVASPTIVAIAGGTSYPMTYDAVDQMWETSAGIRVTPGASVPLSVRVRQENGTFGATVCTKKDPCERTFTDVQRHASASDPRSGPIRALGVSNADGTGANSLERCTATQTACTHDLTVRVGLLGGVQYASSADSEPIALRVAGNQSGSLDCDPNQSNIKSELANGCAPEYQINESDACPNNVVPLNCVPLQTGGAVNQVPAGMNQRILGDEKATTCTNPNQWPEVMSDPDLLASDPRLMPLFITPYGSFDGSGNESVPIRNFAYFYVTGWAGSGGGFSNPCEDYAPHPDDQVPQGAGYVTGHFVKYVSRLNDGSSGDTPCDFRAASPCVAVLTD